jgi:hypothetical protein
VVARQAARAHRPEMTVEAGPELLQAHSTDASAPAGRRSPRPDSPRVPGNRGGGLGRRRPERHLATGVLFILLIRNYRGR